MAVEEIEINQETLQAQSTYCPGAIFMLGARLEYLDEALRKIDLEKNLCLGSILASTPPVWVYKDGFYMGREMVTNGEYAQFMLSAYEDESGRLVRTYDDPDLWEHVWAGMNFRLTDLKMSYKVEDETEIMIENYQGATSFVEAYLLSIRYEIERLLGTLEGDVDLQEIESLFTYARYRMWSMLAEEDDDFGPGDTSVMSRDEAIQSVDRVVNELYNRYALDVDPRFKQALRARKLPVETIRFLARFRSALKKCQENAPIPVHQVIYPRYWDKPTGQKKTKKKFGRGKYGLGKVAWENQPVYGITLYEALAYTAWLTQEAEVEISLPDEAEYERAACWPLEPTSTKESPVILNPYTKSIFPWSRPGDPTICDFNTFFGQEGRTLYQYYFYNAKEYNRLKEDTAKKSPDGGNIHQLLGFGWQWTIDRFDPTEYKYNSFDVHNYPVISSTECKYDPGGDPVPVFEYKPNSNMNHAYYVVRGAPDVIGGPGTVTRRFSMYPLRGYDNVGFRFVFRPN